MDFVPAFEKRYALIDSFGKGNAFLVWAVALYLDYPDLFELGAESLTDGNNDKKIDFLRLDRDSKKILFAQGYFSSAPGKKDKAPANKASDLNTAAAWLLSGDTSTVPDNLKVIIDDCRDAINDGEVEQIDLLYVHNLPESVNVTRELKTVADHLVNSLPADKGITVIYGEFGVQNIERLFKAKESQLTITEEIKCPVMPMFEESGKKWNAAVLSLPGAWLREQFHKYGDKLFSANYRGFLGVTKRRKINTGIRGSAEKAAEDFWVFNNGITILTNKFEKHGDGSTTLSGMSIINGAQTTGSIGSIDSTRFPLTDLKVLCRLIECADPELIKHIVKYNNTQNEITTWDQYSNSPEQKRIAGEFENLGHSYSLKRGYEASDSELGIEVVAQPLISFEGGYREANRGKNSIFDNSQLYRRAFDLKKARHILFVYTLAQAINERRLEFKMKDSVAPLITIEQHQFNLFKNLRFKNFLISIIASCMEQIIGETCDLGEIAFDPDSATAGNKSINDLIVLWLPIISLVLIHTSTLIDTDSLDLSKLMKDEGEMERLSARVGAAIYAGLQYSTLDPNIESFRKVVTARG